MLFLSILLALLSIVLLYCIWIIYNRIKHRSNSKRRLQLYTDLQSLVKPSIWPVHPVTDPEVEFCYICREKFLWKDEICTLTVCGHYFHLLCLNIWIREGVLRCPLSVCDKEIVPNSRNYGQSDFLLKYYDDYDEEENAPLLSPAIFQRTPFPGTMGSKPNSIEDHYNKRKLFQHRYKMARKTIKNRIPGNS